MRATHHNCPDSRAITQGVLGYVQSAQDLYVARVERELFLSFT